MVGCGALGGYYGAKLAHAGQNVHLLLRSDYQAVLNQGISVTSPDGNFTTRPLCARTPEEIGPSDLVIIGLKTTANDQLPGLLRSLVTPTTAVLTLQNGLGNEEALSRLFPREQILGGLCFVCLNRTAPGRITHTGHGRILLGEFQRTSTARTLHLSALFQQAGIDCQVVDDLARAHWEKLVWNIPFNGLGVAAAAGWESCAAPSTSTRISQIRHPVMPTDLLLADPRWESLVLELMLEIINTANALGFAIPESYATLQINRTRSLGSYRASTLIDFDRGQPLELESLFLEPLRQAQAAGVPTPRLETLSRVLMRLSGL